MRLSQQIARAENTHALLYFAVIGVYPRRADRKAFLTIRQS
jgi:hypothetical protein